MIDSLRLRGENYRWGATIAALFLVVVGLRLGRGAADLRGGTLFVDSGSAWHAFSPTPHRNSSQQMAWLVGLAALGARRTYLAAAVWPASSRQNRRRLVSFPSLPLHLPQHVARGVTKDISAG